MNISEFKVGQLVEMTDGTYGVIADISEQAKNVLIQFNNGDRCWYLPSQIKTIVADKSPLVMDMKGGKDYLISNDEYELILDEFETLLNEYGYAYSEDALRKIISKWDLHKSKLRELLRKHPNWDEELQMIKLTENPFHESIDTEEIYQYRLHFFSKRVREYLKAKELYLGMFKFCDYINATGMLNSKLESMIHSRRCSNIICTYNGMTEDELRLEVGRRNKRVQDIEFRIIDGYYIGVDKVDDAILLEAASDMLLEIYEDADRFLDDSVINEEFITKFNKLLNNYTHGEYKTSLLPQMGQKVSKYYAKLCKAYGFDKFVDIQDDTFMDNNGVIHTRQKDHGYNMWAARFGDAVATKEYKEDLYISINLIDYLTQSFLYNATSCHSIDKRDLRECYNGDYQGCYSAGTISYALDETSLVVYTIKRDGDRVYRIGKEADPNCPIYRATKFRRMMVYLGNDKLVCSRLYPDGRDGGDLSISGQWRLVLQKVFADLLNTSNMWTLVRGTTSQVQNASGSAVYADWSNYEDCNVSYLRVIDGWKNTEPIIVGRKPICVECGREHYTAESINCCHPNGMTRCYDCDEELSDEEIVWINDEPYCEHCAREHDYVRCEDTEEWVYYENAMQDAYSGLWYYNSYNGFWADDEYWFIDEYNAKQFGCVYDEIDGEWTYDEADHLETDNYTGDSFISGWHDTVYIEDCVYSCEDNAIADGWEVNSETGEWYRDDDVEEGAA